jgi:hypothetical protein
MHKALFWRGYDRYEYTMIDGRLTLIAYPRQNLDKADPIPLWMPKEYVIVRPREDSMWIQHAAAGENAGVEMNRNIAGQNPDVKTNYTSKDDGEDFIMPGDPLLRFHQEIEKIEGTFAAVAERELLVPNSEHPYLALTAGHVVAAKDLYMKAGQQKVILPTAVWPPEEVLAISPNKWTDWASNEAGMLSINKEYQDFFEPLPRRLDLYHWMRDSPILAGNVKKRTLYPPEANIVRYDAILNRLDSCTTIVHKQGAETGLTTGKLMSLLLDAPRGWYGVPMDAPGMFFESGMLLQPNL